jgi:putative membrane protein
MPMHDYFWGGGGWGGWMLVHGAFWLLLLALIVFGAVVLMRGSRSPGQGSALDLLNERYARGEIDRDEYLQRKKDILEV